MRMMNCVRCGKLFEPINASEKICHTCKKEEEENFQTVKEYIEENPNAIVAEIVNETGVSAKRIQKFLRDGRLEATPAMGAVLTCMSCGMPIMAGKMCMNCQNKLDANINETFSRNEPAIKKQPTGVAKMHITGRR